MAGPLEVVTKFVADTGGLEAGAEKAKGALGGIGPAGLLAGAAVVAGAGVAIAALVDMTKAAAEDEAGQAKLEAAIVSAGAATGDYKKQVDDAIAAGQAKAFTDDQTRDALQSLVTATGDVGTATAELTTAQDIARFAGVDLATAADAVAKAHAGNDGALRKLIPGLEKGATAQDTLAAAQTAAAGQADEYAKTTEGSLAIAGDSFSELGETIGKAFLPLLKAIIPPLTKIIGALGTLIEAVLPVVTPLITILGEVIGVVITDALLPIVDIITKLIAKLLTGLKPALAPMEQIFKDVGKAIGGVVDFIRDLLDFIGRAIDAVGRLLDKLNPLKGFQLPSLPFSLGAPMVAGGLGASSRGASPRAAGGGGTVIVNVYGGDPRRITAAVRDGYRRWKQIEGSSAPDRDY